MSDSFPLFVPANFFLVRTASLPIDFLFSLVKEENSSKTVLEKWLKDPFFRQALAFSSQSLSSQIRKGKINESVILSLFKYFSRITSRGTPYGLLSFVTWGEKGGVASSHLNSSLLAKRARPDMGWVQKYLETIFTDESEFLNLEVQKNPIIIDQGDRYFTDYFIDKTDQAGASIKKNKLTSFIFSQVSLSMPIKKLISLIQNHFPHTESDKITQIIKLLLSQQFLWYTLYPRLNTFSPFEELLKKAPEKYRSELYCFDQEIKNYNLIPLDQGEKDLYELADSMSKKGAGSRLPIQVDLGISSKQLELPQTILDQAAKGGEILWKLGRLISRNPPLKNYHSKFLEKYGQYRLVPLLDLLNPNKGLGIPSYELSMVQKSAKDLDATPYHEWLGDRLSKALLNKENEIVIDQQVVSTFLKEANEKTASNSADLFFEIYADSVEEVNQGNYLIYITNFLNRGGATFGRFIDLLDQEVVEKLKEFYRNEGALEKEILIFDSFYLPQNSNAQNVAISPAFRPNQIDLLPGGASSLHLDQIYIGATREFLYLTNREGGVEFRVTSTNAVVDIQAPEELRFIREVSQERVAPIYSWSWGPYSTLTYLPRVRYEKVILSPAQWRTTLPLIGLNERSSLEEVTDKLSNWFIQLDLPNYLYITERDNRLLINRNLKEHVKIAGAYLKKEKKILFSEKIGQEKGHWIESAKGKHSVEYVLPLIKNPFYSKTERTIPHTAYNDYKISDRWKLPGTEWLYYKFYLPPVSHTLFLQNYLSPFVEELVQERLIDEWFFVRFEEEGRHHIRLRMKISEKNSLPIVFDSIYEFTQDLLEASLIQNISMGSYEREIERYGGIESIGLCENLFWRDSSLAVELLKFESNELPIYVIGALSVLDLLQNLRFDNPKITDFFNSLILEKSELKGYKEWKKKIENGFEKTFGSIGEKRALILRELGARMENRSSSHSLPFFSLASSLVHMHCNRLCGVDPTLENKVKVFGAHYIESSLKKRALEQQF